MQRCKVRMSYKLLEKLLQLPYPIVITNDKKESDSLEIIMEGKYEQRPYADVACLTGADDEQFALWEALEMRLG